MTSISGHRPARATRSPESFESLHRRNAAAEILQSYEKLSWHSFQRCETLNQTRLHFQNIVAGFTPEDEAALVHWKEDFTPRQTKSSEESRMSRKGKERVSTGSSAGVDMAPNARNRAIVPEQGVSDAIGEGSKKQRKRKSGNDDD